jgi:hypothetical protein
MELLEALYTFNAGFHPELIGWWMIWFLRIALPGFPALCALGHCLQMRALRRRYPAIFAKRGF